MKTKLLPLVFVISNLSFLISNAQSPNWLWAKSAGGTSNDKANSITTDYAGHVYVAGVFNSPSITFGSTTLTNATFSSWNMFLVKYDASGNVLWVKGAGGSNGNGANSVSTDASGNVYVVGYFTSPTIAFDSFVLTKVNPSQGYPDVFIVKYNANGNVLWAKNAGGNMADDASSIATDNTGNIYVTGSFSSDTLIIGSDTLCGNNKDVFIAKYDTAGNPIWAKGFFSSGYGPLIASDKYGNAYITGYFSTPTITIGAYTLTNHGNNNIYVAKYNAIGNVLWAKGETWGTGDDEGTSVATDTSGNVYITGFFSSSLLIIGSDTLKSVNGDIFIVKYNANGNVLWAKSRSGNVTNWDKPASIAVDNAGNAYIAGYFSSDTVIFGPSILTNIGMFLAKYDANGNALWGKDAIGGSKATSVSADNLGNVYVAGYFGSDTLGFDSSILLNDTTSSFDIFIAAINSITGVENIANQNDNIFIYPNPSNGKFIVKEDEAQMTNHKLEIYNVFGEKIYSTLISSQSNNNVDISSQPKGIYFVKVQSADKVYTEKVVVQ